MKTRSTRLLIYCRVFITGVTDDHKSFTWEKDEKSAALWQQQQQQLGHLRSA